jgi:uncharacterized protein YsxB (DUF464 family)
LKKSRSRKNGLDIAYERRRGAITGFRVRGHAGFAAAGQDIVCAAASALVLSAVHGLRQYCAVRPKISDTASQFQMSLPNGGNPEAQAVLETTVSGLQAIAAAYPGYMRIRQAKLTANRKSRV